jgi:DNA-directed RNA polymerase specialized sigma subunit
MPVLVISHIEEMVTQMKTEPWFIKTEKLLTFLWLSKDRIKRLEALEKLLLENTHNLENSLNDFKRIPGLTAKYSLVGGQRRIGDYDYAALMAEYENQLDLITKQMIRKHRRLVSIQHRLHNLREEIAPIEAAVRCLAEEEQIILEQKFVYRNSNYHIANLLHCSEKRVRYIYEKTIFHLARKMGILYNDDISEYRQGHSVAL